MHWHQTQGTKFQIRDSIKGSNSEHGRRTLHVLSGFTLIFDINVHRGNIPPNLNTLFNYAFPRVSHDNARSLFLHSADHKLHEQALRVLGMEFKVQIAILSSSRSLEDAFIGRGVIRQKGGDVEDQAVDHDPAIVHRAVFCNLLHRVHGEIVSAPKEMIVFVGKLRDRRFWNSYSTP